MSGTPGRLLRVFSLVLLPTVVAAQVPRVDLRARWSFLLVPVAADGCPVEPISAHFVGLQDTCARFVRAAAASAGAERAAMLRLAADCRQRHDALYTTALVQRYDRADLDGVVAQLAAEPDATRLECLLAISHNAHVEAEIAEKQRAWDAAAATIDGAAAGEGRGAADVAAPERGTRDPWRAVAGALAAALQGYVQGTGAGTRQAASAPSPGRLPPQDGGCSSDYDCPYGSACVKAEFALQGRCAVKVNEFRVPTLEPPDPGSVGVGGPGQCAFDTDCPPLFACVKGPGALRGACLAR